MDCVWPERQTQCGNRTKKGDDDVCEACEASVSDVCRESEVFVVVGIDTAHNTHNDTHTLSQHLMCREKSVSFESSVPVLHSKCAMQSMQTTPVSCVSAEASCF